MAVLVPQNQKAPMHNFTPDSLFDANRSKANRSFSSNKTAKLKSPKASTINNILAFSKALEVQNSKRTMVEVVLN